MVTISGASAGAVTSVAETTHVQVTIPGTGTSGGLVATVNFVPSINNLNGNHLTQNQEPNGVNNNLLTDDRLLSVWSFTTIAGTTTARYPIMRVAPNDTVGFSFASGETQFRMIGSDGVSRVYETNYTRYKFTTLGFDSAGNVYGAALNSDRISDTYGGSSRFGFFYRQPGNRSTGGADGYQNGTFKRHLEHNWNGTVYNSVRSQFPDLFIQGAGTAGDPARIYLSYFDSSANVVKFRYGTVTGAADGNITGVIANNYADATTGTAGSVNGFHAVAAAATSGPYTAVAATSAGIAVMAWYDSTNRYLRYSYNTNPAGATEAQWTTNGMVIDNFFAGQYVDIAVDADDGIHIAYYNSSSGNLKYAYLATYDTATPQTVTIDSFLSVGQNLMIDVREESGLHVPYLSYYVGAYEGTQSSLKMAHRMMGAGALANGAVTDRYTGAWEIQSVPTNNIPKNHTVSVGFGAGLPVVGFAADTGLEYGENH